MPQLYERFSLDDNSGFVFDSQEEVWLTTSEDVYCSIANFLESEHDRDNDDFDSGIDWNDMRPA